MKSERNANTGPPSPPRKPVIDSKTLFQGAREINIAFRDDIYTLRITRNNKLILTK